MTVDTLRPFKVVTQFPAEQGVLKSIRRFYIQDNNVIENAFVNNPSWPNTNFIDDSYCQASGATEFLRLGGNAVMGDAMSRGMVLSMSVWWDTSTYMSWLDAGSAGPCNATEGTPANIQLIQPNTAVAFGNIKWGDIESTF